MARRLFTLGAPVVAFLAVWVYLLRIGLPPAQHSVVLLLPLWALVSFALYSLAVIGWSLAHFPTCAKDAEILQREMGVAQRELCAKGIVRADEFEDAE
jgi:dolichyl-phosphate mannosyltransferase polypeptide 3